MTKIPELEQKAGIVSNIYEILTIEETEKLWDERGKLVTMHVVYADAIPRAFVNTRAKQRAVRSVGVIDVTSNTVTDLFRINQDVENMAEVKFSEEVDDTGAIGLEAPAELLQRFDSLNIMYYEILVRVE